MRSFYELGLGAGGTLFHGDVGAVAFNAEGHFGLYVINPSPQSRFVASSIGIGAHALISLEGLLAAATAGQRRF